MKSAALLSLVFLVIISVFISLGCWQWRRAHEKQQLLNQAHDSTVNTPSLAQLLTPNKDLAYMSVRVAGRYDAAHTFYLMNQFHQHQLGRHVVTPFIIEGGAVLLVDRGWVTNEAVINDVLPTQHLVLQGRLKIVKRNPFIHDRIDHQQPLTLLQYDLPLLSAHWHQTLLPVVLLLDPQQAHGFVRDWVVTVMPPARHIAYAVQWFALAGVSIIILSVLLLRLKK